MGMQGHFRLCHCVIIQIFTSSKESPTPKKDTATLALQLLVISRLDMRPYRLRRASSLNNNDGWL